MCVDPLQEAVKPVVVSTNSVSVSCMTKSQADISVISGKYHGQSVDTADSLTPCRAKCCSNHGLLVPSK